MSSISSTSSSSTQRIIYPNRTQRGRSATEAVVSKIANTHITSDSGNKKTRGNKLASKNVKIAGEVTGGSDAYKPRADTIELTFDAVTRYLPNRDALLASRVRRVKAITWLSDQLDKANWTQVIRRYKQTPSDLALDGLKSCHDGKITVEQFSTLIFCYSLLNQFPNAQIEVQSIFNQDGTVNQRAQDFIKSTLKVRGIYDQVTSSRKEVLDKEGFDVFLEKMRKQPASEQSFFFIKAQPYISNERIQETLDGTLSINKEISYFLGMNVFHEIRQKRSTYRMIPSLSMMQQVLIASARSVDDAVKITPVIGLSTEEDILNNGMTDTRDMALPFPEVDLPKKADELKAQYDIDFIFHDFYHAFIATEIPAKFRRAFIDYAKAICRVKEQTNHPKVTEFLQELYERIIDMEHLEFNRYESVSIRSNTGQFMTSVADSQKQAFNRLNIKRIHAAGLAESELDPSQQDKWAQEIAEQEPIKHLAQELIKNNFFESYSIDINEIRKAYADLLKNRKNLKKSLKKILILRGPTTGKKRNAVKQADVEKLLKVSELMDISAQISLLS